jgi:hypothetical protein
MLILAIVFAILLLLFFKFTKPRGDERSVECQAVSDKLKKTSTKKESK